MQHAIWEVMLSCLTSKLLTFFEQTTTRIEEQIADIVFYCIKIWSLLDFKKDCSFLVPALIEYIGQFPHIQMLGRAFWETSTQYTGDDLKMILQLCAVMCMHPKARIALYIRLAGINSKLANAFRKNSLIELAEAVNKFQMVPGMPYTHELMREYPTAHVAQNPFEFQSLRFTLDKPLHTICEKSVHVCVLLDVGIPCHEIHKLLKNVKGILSNEKVDLPSVERVVRDLVRLSKIYHGIGDALLTIERKRKETTETDTVVWLLCALICMHPEATHYIHAILLGVGFKEIAKALFFNSTCLLSDALGRVKPEMFETIMQLIFAFLTHYPNAYDAHMSNRLLCANI
jgi:hypothetical protein